MPQSMDTLGDAPVLKTLVLATAKTGKTSTVAMTATKALGPGYIACCSTSEHLRSAKELCSTHKVKSPEFDMIQLSDINKAKVIDDMEAALKTARVGVKEGAYKWVMCDDFGMFASAALEAFSAQHKGDGRRYWDQYTRHVSNVVLRWLALPAPVFFTMHYMETGAEIDGQVAKSGPGIVPSVQGGTLRQFIPGQFNQVIWMEKRGTERIFRLSVEGVTGPGCNNLPEDVREVPADVGALIAALSCRGLAAAAKKR